VRSREGKYQSRSIRSTLDSGMPADWPIATAEAADASKPSGLASGHASEVTSLKDNSSKLSRDEQDEAEKGIEEAFEPPRDEESGFHHSGGHHAVDEKQESDLVDWDGPDDPENPQNMSKARKWWISMISALMTFVVSFGSSVFSTATEVTAEHFHVSTEVMILGVTVYVIG
jgi:MFS transporter, DHA1 family, multidrug resistance protein